MGDDPVDALLDPARLLREIDDAVSGLFDDRAGYAATLLKSSHSSVMAGLKERLPRLVVEADGNVVIRKVPTERY